jgi:hypothetical protein
MTTAAAVAARWSQRRQADEDFLRTEHDHARWVTIGGGDDALIGLGHSVCRVLESGYTRQQAHDALVTHSQAGDSDTSWIITAAVGAYCPGAG